MTTYIEGALTIWYLLTAGAMVFLIWDLLTNTPANNVIKLAWVLVVFYTGPVGLFIYLLSCRQTLPGMHDAFIAPLWKQATGSLLHCVAGDATGIILSAAIVYHFGLPNGIDLIIEYLSAFIVGLFVFQALFMLAMYGGNYWLAVRKTFFAETVSMNMVMVGMIPTMMILMHVLPGSDDPTRALFWGVMSVSTLAGMITAYPINYWLVSRGLKHGMMSAIPKPKDKEVGLTSTGMNMKSMQNGTNNSLKHEHHARPLSGTQALTILIGTFGVLALAIWLTTLFVPITFM